MNLKIPLACRDLKQQHVLKPKADTHATNGRLKPFVTGCVWIYSGLQLSLHLGGTIRVKRSPDGTLQTKTSVHQPRSELRREHIPEGTTVL